MKTLIGSKKQKDWASDILSNFDERLTTSMTALLAELDSDNSERAGMMAGASEEKTKRCQKAITKNGVVAEHLHKGIKLFQDATSVSVVIDNKAQLEENKWAEPTDLAYAMVAFSISGGKKMNKRALLRL
jgi:hypothetical protein